MDRFWNKTEPIPECGCMIWTDHLDRDGYGFYWHNKKILRAHRFSWEAHYGPIPKGLHVLHSCDTPSCVNPHHLFLGTQSDNMKDMAKKKRSTWGHKNAQTKLIEEQVREILKYKHPYSMAVAKKYNVSLGCIQNIVQGNTWKHIR